MDEKVFEVPYSEKKSRPNVPVNILVGCEALKSGFGLTDGGYTGDTAVRAVEAAGVDHQVSALKGRKAVRFSAGFCASRCDGCQFSGHLCKLPVRGKSWVTTMIVQSAVMVKIRRIRGNLCPKGLKIRISGPILQC